MSLDERIGWVLLGMAIGYVLRTLQEVRKEVHEVDETLKRDKNEKGFMRNPIIADFVILTALGLCVFAAISTQITNNRLEATVVQLEANQKDDRSTRGDLKKITVCSQDFLSKTIVALNERTEYTQERTDANVELQRAQYEFLQTMLVGEPSEPRATREALSLYISKLENFNALSSKNKEKVQEYAYPTKEELNECLSRDDG